MQSAEQFGNKLRELRTARGLTQRQLADLMIVSNGTIGNWETGKRLPDLSMRARLAGCLGVETWVLIDALRGSDCAPRIIVVEDVPVVLRGSIHMLEEELPGAEILGFSNAADALTYSNSNPVSIAFLDIELPGEDGIKLGRKLTQLDEHTNIIFLTSHIEYLQEATYDHCSGYVLKPLTPDRIRHEISHLRFPVRGLNL